MPKEKGVTRNLSRTPEARERGATWSPDGKSIALLMRENNRVYNSFISFSKDEGKTWSEPRQMPDSLTGDRHQQERGALQWSSRCIRILGERGSTNGPSH